MVNVVQRDRPARELSAWGDDLRKQGERLAKQVASVLGRLAETEEHLAEAFAHRALITPHRADELSHCARQARVAAERFHRTQAHLRQVIVPGWRNDKP